jgi:hypothetical protein
MPASAKPRWTRCHRHFVRCRLHPGPLRIEALPSQRGGRPCSRAKLRLLHNSYTAVPRNGAQGRELAGGRTRGFFETALQSCSARCTSRALHRCHESRPAREAGRAHQHGEVAGPAARDHAARQHRVHRDGRDRDPARAAALGRRRRLRRQGAMRGLGLPGRRPHSMHTCAGRANSPAPPAAALDLPCPAKAAWHGTSWPAQRPRTPQAGLGRRSVCACWLCARAYAAAAARRSAPRPESRSAGRRPGSRGRLLRTGPALHALQRCVTWAPALQPVQLMPPCGARLGAWRVGGRPGRAGGSPTPSPALVRCGYGTEPGAGQGRAAGPHQAGYSPMTASV